MLGLIFKLFHAVSTIISLCHYYFFRPLIKITKRKITRKCEIYRMIEKNNYDGLSLLYLLIFNL